MAPPGITRHRRPFLAPLWVTMLALLVAAAAAYTAYRGATTTVVVLASSGEREPGTIEDPPISAEGEHRAQRLAQLFAPAGGPGRLDAIYVSGERRAEQTAAPLAELLHLTPTVYDARNGAAVAADLLRSHEGSAVLVIGGAAALQQILRQLAGSGMAPQATADPGLLYIVSVPSFGRPRVLRLKY
ncbi:MAG TPA: phosphoglycerate mutase family protein [Steroidobacteraceae bacterium]|nr:phosphoglycerate mutase family protein [Steroidobacteraceae bacterium]